MLDREQGGPDARFSLEPSELREMVQKIRVAEAGTEKSTLLQSALGSPYYGAANALEEYNKRWRRSLFSGRAIKKGERFTKENVRDVRPAFGLPTNCYDQIIGKKAVVDIPFATPLSWDMIS